MEKSVGNEGRSSSARKLSTSAKRETRRAALTFAKIEHEQSLHLLLFWSDELNGETFLTRSRSSSRSMNVGIGGSRELIVHDVRDRGDVESTSGNVGREENRIRLILESVFEVVRFSLFRTGCDDGPIERLQTSTLLHAGMQLHDVDAEQDEKRMKSTNSVD